MTKAMRQWLPATALVALVVTACAPQKTAPEKAAAAMLKYDATIREGVNQMDAVIEALKGLRSAEGSTVAAQYQYFSKQVDALDKLQQDVTSDALAAAKQQDLYLSQWQEAHDKIQNPELKAAAEARRSELLPAIEQIRSSLGSARTSFDPMMQNLKDLRLFLGNDLTPTGLAAAQGQIDKCDVAAARVRADIALGTQGLRDLAGRIQPGRGTEK